MSERRITEKDYDTEVVLALLSFSRRGITFQRKETGSVLTYEVSDGQGTLGRITVAPGTPRIPHSVTVGFADEVGHENNERHSKWRNLCRQIKDSVDFRLGIGRHATSKTGHAPMLTDEELTDLIDQYFETHVGIVRAVRHDSGGNRIWELYNGELFIGKLVQTGSELREISGEVPALFNLVRNSLFSSLAERQSGLREKRTAKPCLYELALYLTRVEPIQVADRLQQHTGDAPFQDFTGGDYRLSLQSAHPEWIGKMLRLSMSGTYSYRGQYLEPGPVIEFDLAPLSEDRVRMDTRVIGPLVGDYFCEVLHRMAQDYPEIGEQIRHLCQQEELTRLHRQGKLATAALFQVDFDDVVRAIELGDERYHFGLKHWGANIPRGRAAWSLGNILYKFVELPAGKTALECVVFREPIPDEGMEKKREHFETWLKEELPRLPMNEFPTAEAQRTDEWARAASWLHVKKNPIEGMDPEELYGPMTEEKALEALGPKTLEEAAKEFLAEDVNVAKERVAEAQDQLTVDELISKGESDTLEFKSTLQWDVVQNRVNKELHLEVLKSIDAFLNTNGGTLLIGVMDDGTVCGLENDLRTTGGSRDQFQQLLASLVSNRIGREYGQFIQVRFEPNDGKVVCRIQVKPAPKHAFVQVKGKPAEFYIRVLNTTCRLDSEEILKYWKTKWGEVET